MTNSTSLAGAATSSSAATPGLVPLVTYNWNPSTQLAGYLAAQEQVAAGTSGAQATIVAVGDSTTVGFGGSSGDYRPTVSYPADLAAALTADHVAAQGDNFLGQGNEDFTVPDTRLALVGSAIWGYPFVAGGPVVVANGVGQGISFTIPTAQVYDRVTIDYIDSGSGTLDVSVDGGPNLATLQLGNTGLMVSRTIDLPVGLHSNVTITAGTAHQTDIEGASFWSSTRPAVQVLNAGEGGAQSSVVGDGVTPGAGEVSSSAALGANLALINFGINDILQGNLTAAQTTANIALMVKEFRANGTDPVIIIPQPFAGASYTAEIASLRSDIYQLSTDMNVPVIDLSATYNDNYSTLAAQGLLTSDNVHPSALLYSDIASGIATLLTGTVTPQAPVTPVVPVPPAVVLISAPSVAAGGSVVLGTATAAGSDSLSVALVSDSLVTTGNSIALRNGQIVYTPGNYGTSQAGTDRIAYSVTDTTNGTVTSETQSLTLQAPAAVTTAPGVVLGSGPQSITLGISEDAYLGNALFTIAVDGVQIGGTQTALAPHGGSSDQAFTVNGSFASGSHTVVVDFLNDAYAGTPQTDRNLYVDTIAAGGVSSHVGAALLSQGPQSFNVTLAGTPAVPPTVSLAPAPTAASGGSVVLGTVTASRGDALTIALTSDASLGAGSTIALQNGTIVYTPGSYAAPQAGTDKIAYNITDTVNHSVVNETQSVILTAPASSSPPPGAGTIVLGSGPDTLALQISEDAWLGDAQFTVAVNGTQIGGVQTATALHSTGSTQSFHILGSFTGQNSASITFLNDAYAGTPTTDRNLYLNNATFDGSTVAGGSLTELGDGTMSFLFGSTATTSANSPVVLKLSEDAYKGDAQFVYSIDGGATSAPQTVTALHASGASEAFSLGNLAAGAHDIAVSFVNDLYAGTPTTDRNLYVDGITVKGAVAPSSSSAILGDWTTHFAIVVPPG